MQAPTIVRLLKFSPTSQDVRLALDTLRHFHTPLTERERGMLQKFTEEKAVMLEAGTKEEDIEVPGHIRPLLAKPFVEIPAPQVVQIVFALSKMPQITHRVQKVLQREILPSAAGFLGELPAAKLEQLLQVVCTDKFFLRNRTTLRCAEELLKALSKPIWGLAEPVDDVRSAKEKWCEVLTLVLREHSKGHSAVTKSPPPGKAKCGHALFASSMLCKRLFHHLRMRPEVAAFLFQTYMVECTLSQRNAFPTWIFACAASGGIETAPRAIPSSVVLAAVRGVAGAVKDALSDAPPQGTLVVDDVHALLKGLLEVAVLPNVSAPQVRDMFVALEALAPADMSRCLVGAGAPLKPIKFIEPFFVNAKCFSTANAAVVAPHFGRALGPCADTAVLATLIADATEALQESCASGDEKVSVLTLVAAVLKHVSDVSLLPPATAIVPLVRSAMASSVTSLLRAGALVVASARAEEALQAQIAAAFKSQLTSEPNRRVLLTTLRPQSGLDISATAATKLITDAPEVEAFRLDAFLALAFANVPITKECCAAVSQPATIGTLRQSDECCAAARAAIRCLAAGFAEPFAALLTHRSGSGRKILVDHLNAATTANEQRAAVWASLMGDILGLTSGSAPATCGAAGPAVAVAASAMLRHFGETISAERVADFVLACGHSGVIGADSTHFSVHPADLLGRYARQSVNKKTFAKVFTNDFDYLLEKHADAITSRLCNALPHESEHVAQAAGCAVALYLTRISPDYISLVFERIRGLCEESVRYFSGLTGVDAALATGSAAIVQAHADKVLTERGLLKEYSARPPKGMSDEDYEDLKRRELLALAKARTQIEADFSKRREAIHRSVRAHLSPFAALRVVGRANAARPLGVQIVYPLLQRIVGDPVQSNAALYEFAISAATALLSRTPLHTVAAQMIRLAGIMNALPHTDDTVMQASSISTRLRLHAANMMDAPLLTPLIPFVRGAFKNTKGRGAKALPLQAQHQLLNVFVANCGQEESPSKGDVLEVLISIVHATPSLYRQVSHAMLAVVSHVHEAELEPIIQALFTGDDLVKDCAAHAFGKFQYFRHHLRPQAVAFALQHDANRTVNEMAKSVVSCFTLEEDHWPALLGLLRQFAASMESVERLAKTVKQLFIKFPAKQCEWINELLALSGGTAAVTTMRVCASALDTASAKAAMLFLCATAQDGRSDEVTMYEALQAGKELLTSCDDGTVQILSRDVQPRLQAPITSASAEHKDLYNAISIVWQTAMAKRLSNTAFLEATIDHQTQVLSSSSSAMVHEFVCECMCDIAQQASIKESAKLTEFGTHCVKQTINSGSYPRKKAHAYGLAGVVSGLGVSSLRRFNVVDSIIAASGEKQAQRSGAMILIEVLADIVGSPFEPYALRFIPIMLDAVSEKDSKISDCADDAAKAVMRTLSDIGLRQLVPLLVSGVRSEQTKKRTPSLGFIGYVAFCSPKQLAATLPSIMGHITECICDANASVANAAFMALRRVAGVVSNPEIQEQVDTILAAMRNPSGETENALDALIYTRFMNAVDPASLALVIPVVMRGLAERGHTIKGKAAQIVASMLKLVRDPKSLQPYASELLRRLENTAQDPQAEVRTTSAKAIAALCANLLSGIVDDVTAWAFAVLSRANTSAEKAGAAQVLVETLAACGETLLYNIYDKMESGVRDEVPNVREGFTYIMVYAPATMPVKMFQDFLPAAFPWVLRGLSDTNEKVREVALAAGTSIITLYGMRNLSLVLDPLLEGVVSEHSNSRYSSMLLAAKLLIHLVQQIKKKLKINVNDVENGDDKEENEDDQDPLEAGADEPNSSAPASPSGEIHVESARDAEKKGFSILGNLEEQLGAENFVRLLAAMHIGRSEHNLVVRTEVTTAWQICVASPRAAIAKIFGGIVTMLVKFASSPTVEANDVAQKSLEYTCSRLQETSEKFIDAFSQEYHKGGLRHRIGALTCMADVIPCTDSGRVMKMGGPIVGCVLPALQDEDEVVRTAAGLLFERISKAVGSRLIESVIESQLETSITGVVEVVKVRPTAALAIIFNRFSAKDALTPDNIELISAILTLDQVDDDIPKFYDKIATLLTRSCIQKIEGAADAITNFAAYLDDTYASSPIADMAKMMKSPETREGVLVAAAAYGEGLAVECTVALEAVFKVLLAAVADFSERVATTATTCLINLVAGLDKRVIESLDTAEQSDLTASKRAAGKYVVQFMDVFQQTLGATARAAVTEADPELPCLGYPKMFDTIVGIYTRALDYGNGTQKVQAVDCIEELLHFTPKAVTVKAVPTITGKCTKTLFVRNEGPVVAALLKLCLTLMNYPTNSASERMVESALASAVLSPALCDFAEARTLAMRIAVSLVKKNPMTADMMLSAVVSKRNSIESGAQKIAVCHFISAVMRHGNVTKKQTHVPTLLALAKGFWENADSAALCAAAASAVGALCNSASVADDEVASLVDRALAQAATRSTQAIGSFAALYSFMVSVPARLDESIYSKIAIIIQGSITFGASDRLATLWLLRCIAVLAKQSSTRNVIKPDAVAVLLKRTDRTDDQTLCTAFFCITELANAFPAQADSLWQFNNEQSQLMIDIGAFDADLEDESNSETMFYR